MTKIIIILKDHMGNEIINAPVHFAFGSMGILTPNQSFKLIIKTETEVHISEHTFEVEPMEDKEEDEYLQ